MDRNASTNNGSTTVQRLGYNMLRSLRCNVFDTEMAVRKRLRRWMEQGRVTGPEAVLARRFIRNLEHLKNNVPPSVLAAMMRTMWNGWCTDRRFQQRASNRCRLAADCRGEDSIEHYSCCGTVWSFARQRMRLPEHKRGLQYFLLLENMDVSTAVRLSIVVYAVYDCVNTMRVQDQRCAGDANVYLWERTRATLLRNGRCAQFFHGIWQ